MNFSKSPFPGDFEDKKLELFSLVAATVTPYKETTLS